MSKKKSFSGSTMTLKDFHGGSIPSDLPLPSAPGVIVRPSDRSTFDRQLPGAAWGGSVGRSDHRSRPGSSGAARSFDEKTSFLSHPPHIGQNFDEDERKPFDGGASVSSRRSVRDDDAGIRPSSVGRADHSSNPSSGKLLSAAWPSSAAPSSHAPIAASVKQSASAVTSQRPGSNGGQSTVTGSAPNAWGMKRDVVEPIPASTLSGPLAVTKLAQASALEKISSGRWQSKPSTPPVSAPLSDQHVPDVEVIRYSETENEEPHQSAGQVNNHLEYDGRRGMYGDSSVREYPDGERGRGSVGYTERVRPASSEGKTGGSQYQSQFQAPCDAPERPKLKLLPRTKPLEPSDTQVVDLKQVYRPSADSDHVDAGNELNANVNASTPVSAAGDAGSRTSAERPKLNLKRRSQPLEQSDGNIERERNSLFGGARPRELVLKERGVDELLINNLDLNPPANRVKQDVPKADMKLETAVPNTRYSERPENPPPDHRTGRDFDRKDHRPDNQKTDTQRGGSWKNENRRNGRDFEKQNERRQEPESWRKPVEPPKPGLSENTQGPRYGKAASPLELAQAFSRSAPDPKPAERFNSQRNLPGRNQLPFSRLTDARELYPGQARRQINGY